MESENKQIKQLNFSSAIWGEAGMFVLALFFIYMREFEPSYWGNLRTTEAIVYGVVGGFLSYLVIGATYLVPGSFTEDLKKQVAALKPMFDKMPNWQLVAIGISAGIAEEFLFREVLQTWVKGYWGGMWAIIVASLAFGFAHAISVGYIILTVIIGLVLGYLYEITGSLVLVMLIHGVYDIIALLVIRHKPHWLKL